MDPTRDSDMRLREMDPTRDSGLDLRDVDPTQLLVLLWKHNCVGLLKKTPLKTEKYI